MQEFVHTRPMKLYHGSPNLFAEFRLDAAGGGTGIKYGFGVYLTESERTAVHYSQPRHADLMPDHYLYTVEIPDLTVDNHLVSARPVPDTIVRRVAERLGREVPANVRTHGKDFRKWIGRTLLGTKTNGMNEERAAAALLESVGVHYNVWPTAQTKPDGDKNVAVFDPARVRILGVERIEIENRRGKWVLVGREEVGHELLQRR